MSRDDTVSATISAARAFYDDPVLGWFQPRLLRQQRSFHRPFGAVIGDALQDGEAWVATVEGRVRGVAAWLPPGSYPRSIRRDLRVAIRSLPAFLPPSRHALGGVRLVATIERAHPNEPHWYLALLAVDPLLQGRGLGTALLQPVLARADDDGLLAYLETQKPENVPWYARSGFTVTETFQVGPFPPVWGLRREPARRP
jgi:GNAT superfamily N-acetyltransferase